MWYLPGQDGDADAVNRGHVSHILLVEHRHALWVIGSGPSPAFGRRLARLIEQHWPGRDVELISPWAHPESVLGVQGLRIVRHWAHAEVAEQMRQRCESCLQRLEHRMGEAAVDLRIGATHAGPVELAQQVFEGSEGTLGPFRWRRLRRAADVTVTLWAVQGLVFAPGLLWGDAPPDARDADTELMSASTQQLVQGPSPWSTASIWLGQQGRPVGRAGVDRAVQYWAQLLDRALRGQCQGDDGLLAPPCEGLVPASWCTHERHALNWQRAWRQAESRWLQRSLR